MKRALAIGWPVVAILISLTTTPQLHARDHLFIQLGGNYLRSLDKGFQATYGADQFSPELKAGLRLIDGIYAWLGDSAIFSQTTIPVVEDMAHSWQNFLGGGLMWKLALGRTFSWTIHAGAHGVFLRETLADAVSHHWLLGFETGTGIDFRITRRYYAGLGFSFLFARGTVGETEIFPGGLRAGVNLGILL